MNEPICLARARKTMKIEIKAGDWVILTSPEGTFWEANSGFEKVNGNVSEDFSRVLIGKVQHSRPAKNPFTKKQNEDRLSQVSVQDKKVQEIAAGARERSNEIQEKKNLEIKKAHLTEHEKVNAIAEQIRKATNYKS